MPNPVETTIVYPLTGVLTFSHFGQSSYPGMAGAGTLAFSGAVAATATATLAAASVNNKISVLRCWLSIDAGGPFLLIIPGYNNIRIRQTPPFFVVLDFAPIGLTSPVNTAWQLTNEHATIAANVEFLAIGGRESP